MPKQIIYDRPRLKGGCLSVVGAAAAVDAYLHQVNVLTDDEYAVNLSAGMLISYVRYTANLHHVHTRTHTHWAHSYGSIIIQQQQHYRQILMLEWLYSRHP